MMIVHCDSELFSLQDLCSAVFVALVRSCQNNFTSTSGANAWWTRAEFDLDKPLQTPGHRVCHTRVAKDNFVAATFESCCQHCHFLGCPVARTCPQG